MKSFFRISGAKENKKQQKGFSEKSATTLNVLGFLSSSSTPTQIHLALPHGGINHRAPRHYEQFM